MLFPNSAKNIMKGSFPEFGEGEGVAAILCDNMKILKGSATVEALLILPVAYSFVMFLIWFIRIFGIHSEIGAILGDVGASYVENSYVYSAIEEEGVTENGLSDICEDIITEGDLIMRIERSYAYNFVEDMYCGINIFGTGDNVDLWADYLVQPPVRIPGFNGVRLHNRYYARKFTGYTKENADEEMVYVTKESEVYHTGLNCRGLKTTINEVSFSSLKRKRNKTGGKYYACEKCVKGKFSGNVFITPHGDRYHSKSDCQELKLHVYKIPLSETGGKRKCFYCE